MFKILIVLLLLKSQNIRNYCENINQYYSPSLFSCQNCGANMFAQIFPGTLQSNCYCKTGFTFNIYNPSSSIACSSCQSISNTFKLSCITCPSTNSSNTNDTCNCNPLISILKTKSISGDAINQASCIQCNNVSITSRLFSE